MAIAAICPDPIEANCVGNGAIDQIQSQVAFGPHNALDHLRGYPRLFASLRDIDPLLGHVEQEIDKCHSICTPKGGTDHDLSVVHFAQPPVLLPRHASKTFSLLCGRRFVKIQRTIRLTPEKAVSLPGHFTQLRLLVPR